VTREASAAPTCWTKSFHIDVPTICDTLRDNGTKFSHLEIIAVLIERHTQRALASVQDAVYRSKLFLLPGAGPHLADSMVAFRVR
jgi:Mn-containing catalase